MKKNSFDLLIIYSIGFVLSVFLLLTLSFIFYTKFGLSANVFIYITPPLLIASLFLGFFLARDILKPLFDRNRALDIFVKDTLHELNIPIATIKANVELLRKNTTDEKVLKRLNRIELASENLLKLYNELNYKIKEEIDSIDIEEFNIKDTIAISVKKFDDIKNDIIITQNIDDFFIIADKNGFERVIDNIISNAIKYNKPNGTINIYMKEQDLIIEDTGIGIDENKLIHIFERYYRADDTRIGHGIGLNIVKSYCDNNKIPLRIESNSNFGTRLWLSLQKACQNSENNKKLIKKG